MYEGESIHAICVRTWKFCGITGALRGRLLHGAKARFPQPKRNTTNSMTLLQKGGAPGVIRTLVAVNSLLILRNLRAKRRTTDPSNVRNIPNPVDSVRKLADEFTKLG